jgi:hypothetical protein
MTMSKHTLAVAIGLAFAATGAAHAAPPDWGKVPAKTITVFYPGVSPMEWITKGSDHGGARAFRKGETCASCHDEETADMGKKIVSGQKIEPTPPKGKAASIPVAVQAANDGQNLYMRFQWKQPPASGGAKMDAENPVKLAFMLEDGKFENSGASGCWTTCHQDSRTMPEAKDDKKTKYVAGASLDGGKFFDLLQWRSKGKPVDGHVAEARVMEGGSALVSAEGKQNGDTWTVVFTRKLAGGKGDVALQSGKTYAFGFAIHDDHAAGRFHHVSLGYTLGIDAKADISAAKQ